MAIRAKYTRQMPWVGSDDQAEIIDRQAEERGISKAEVIREAFDYVYGLRSGDLPPNVTAAQAAAMGQELVSQGLPTRAATPA